MNNKDEQGQETGRKVRKRPSFDSASAPPRASLASAGNLEQDASSDSASIPLMHGKGRKPLTVTEELQAKVQTRLMAEQDDVSRAVKTQVTLSSQPGVDVQGDHRDDHIEVGGSAPRVQIRNSTTVVKAERSIVRGRLQMLNVSETVVYTYLDGPKVSIGRAAHMDIVALTEGVSRTHARFERHAKGFKILDAQSENGTYLNGKRVEQAELYDGDIIRLGRLQLRYETVGWTRLRKRRRTAITPRPEPSLSSPPKGTTLIRLSAAFASAMLGVFVASWLSYAPITPPASTPGYWQSRVEESMEQRAWKAAMEDLEVARVFGLAADVYTTLDNSIRQAFIDQKTIVLLSEGMSSGLSWKQIRQLASQISPKSVYADEARTTVASIEDTFLERWVRAARRLYMSGRQERLDEVLSKIQMVNPKHEILAEMKAKRGTATEK